jgi:hypothetical protein
MGTRTNIRFTHGKTVCSNIYRHWDGYPGKVENGEQVEYGVLSDLLKFFREVKENVNDTRFGDATYLAAKYLVWQAKQNTVQSQLNFETGEREETVNHYLDFLSVGPVLKDCDWSEYFYKVDCEEHDAEGFPVVHWKPNEKGARYRKVYLTGKPKGERKVA